MTFAESSFKTQGMHSGLRMTGSYQPTRYTQPSSLNPLQNQSGQQASYSTNARPSDNPTIHDVFETKTGTWQYVVADPSTLAAVIIDPVLDYDAATNSVSTTAADALLALVQEKGYTVDKILETHVHADHLTAASYLQTRLTQLQGSPPPIGIGKRIEQVQKLFSERYIVPEQEYKGIFDKLFDDNEVFTIGKLTAMAIHLPGHTPDHLGYKIGGEFREPALVGIFQANEQSR